MRCAVKLGKPGWLLVLLLAGALPATLRAQPYGLTNRPVVGAFFNGALPPAEASANTNAGALQAGAVFPGLTFNSPTFILPEPASQRMYVGERDGTIYFFTNTPAVTSKTVFLNLAPPNLGNQYCELLGMAFHPQFNAPGGTNRYVYVYYGMSPDPVLPTGVTDVYTLLNRLERYAVPAGSLVANPASRTILINLVDRHTWHRGGGMFFGSDGFLYLSIGDEGGNYDAYNSTQVINQSLFSGVFRMDVDKDPAKSHAIRRQPITAATPPAGWPASYTSNYFIPNDNPWVNTNGSVLEEFYALGFRSPHRMTYDSVSNRIWLGDVGQASWEEVDVIEKGGNYQWAYREGNYTGFKTKPSPIIGTDKPPVYDYPHANGDNCVIGGYVYRGTDLPALYGKYIYSDNGSSRVWAMTYSGTGSGVVTQLCTVPAPANTYGVTTLGYDANNELYFGIGGNNVSLYKLTTAGTPPPPPPNLLSQVGVFTNLLTLAPHPAMTPFTVNAPLWSDNAAKQRWLIVPNDGAPYGPGETIGYTSNGNWTFPTGTVLVKHFELPINDTNPAALKRLETRFLVYSTNAQWYGLTYKWRADNSDADLLPGALNETNLITTATGLRTQVWAYPSRTDCRSCHNANAGGVLGPRTSQLNGSLLYPATGVADNQLRALNHVGFFNPNLNEAAIPSLPKTYPLSDTNASLEVRVRSYLQANCAHCHQPNGATAFFDARYSTPLTNQNIVGGNVDNDLGITGAKVVRPQSLAQSILYIRDSTVGTNTAMPPLAKNLVDTNYIAVLAAWINSLPPFVDLPNGSPGQFGNTNTSTASDNFYDGQIYINAARFTAASNFTAAFIRARVTNIAGSYKCALYADNAGSPGNLIATTAAVTAPALGWQTFNFGAPVPLTGGLSYWLAIWTDSPDGRIFYSSATGGTVRWGQYNYGNSWPDPLLVTNVSSAFLYSLYASSGDKPVFAATPANRTIGSGTALTVTNAATDADAPAQSLTYYLLTAPTNAAISPAGVITWTPSAAQSPATNTLRTAVTDGIFSVTNSFQVIVTNLNHPPAAVVDALTRWVTQGLTVAATNLLANDIDSDGDPLTLVNVTNVAPAGFTLLHSNGFVTYWPAFGNTNPGSFNYIISDGHGGSATGLVNVAVQPDPTANDVLALSAAAGAEVVVELSGQPGFAYTVQFTDDLTPPLWQNLGAAIADNLGRITLTNTMPADSTNRFYRAVRGYAP